MSFRCRGRRSVMSATPNRVEEGAVVAAARGGDEGAFATLVERYRRQLQVHCYRMLGSLEDAEDAVQETFLRAWRKRRSFAGRSSFRAWLYGIATNACLDALARRRQPARSSEANPGEIPWLQPYPDRLLEGVAPSEDEPDAVVVDKETIELAFLVAIQHLPPRQRAVLILRDVLGWSAKETAALLESSVASVTSALQRARATMRDQLPERREDWARSTDLDAGERAVLQRYLDAHERGNARAVAELLAKEVRLTMPPDPGWFTGRDVIVRLHEQVFDPASSGYHGRWRSVPTRANRLPAVAHYCERPSADLTRSLRSGSFKAQALDVLRVIQGRVFEITTFGPDRFASFDLPL